MFRDRTLMLICIQIYLVVKQLKLYTFFNLFILSFNYIFKLLTDVACDLV